MNFPSSQATAAQAWAILQRHAREEISSLRLQELCADTDRVSSLVAVHTSHFNDLPPSKTDLPHILIADISRQRMTLDTLQHLLRLARARELRQFIDLIAWGKYGAAKYKNIHTGDPSFPMYVALRSPANEDMKMIGPDGLNVLDSVHKQWALIEKFATQIRTGQVKGVSGQQIRDVIVVGRGVAVMALRFFYDALRRDKEAGLARVTGSLLGVSSRPLPPRRLRFVSNVDPAAAENAAAELNPANTLIISIVMSIDEEMAVATETMKSWLASGLGKYKIQTIEDKHIVTIAANETVYQDHVRAIKRKSIHVGEKENTFFLPRFCQCEAFSTFSVAGLLPLGIIFGWKIVEKILAGAHDIDVHFIESNLRHNLPVLLSLTDLWNDAFLASSGRMCTPFSQPFLAFPEFVSMLESETCGRAGKNVLGATAPSGAVFSGGAFGEYDRMLYGGGRPMPLELITAMDTQAYIGVANDPVKSQRTQDASICSYFAHADLLAFGTRSRGGTATARIRTFSDGSDGNKPSTLILCGRSDAFTCGQLIALSEHRAAINAKLYGVDPFASRVKVGAALRSEEIDRLSEKLHRMYEKGFEGRDSFDDENESVAEASGEGKINLATSTILNHYANRMRDQKLYVVK
eukprot:CAMPEP_0116010178 /NCGR_PEP_ID=MMETSP0321-20121206/3855_1 /TAXON_ID=163516 /ORGANISM="Leptocylindrus danicus var. danicus, Strain B650" /LENGTH=634 /DNA_ID=CAMNT_0003479245 /DNA_START=40 /DNA_END=1944 /DNA_ORIENTATION=+